MSQQWGMQANLRSLFAGKREAVELPPKRGPGRPPKVRKREEDVEQPDELVEALQSVPEQPEAYDERLRVRHRKRKADCLGSDVDGRSTTVLAEAAGKTVAELRMPGSQQRDSTHWGPQVRLRLCQWFEKTHVDLGGSDETHEVMVCAVAETWGIPRGDIVGILKNKERWLRECDAR